jgi:predicted ester cyclase
MTRGMPRTGIHSINVIPRMLSWPGQSEPTRGIKAHQNEGVEMFKTFPDNHFENNPYKVLFGQGDWTCSIAIFTGTHKGPMMAAEGKRFQLHSRNFKWTFAP